MALWAGNQTAGPSVSLLADGRLETKESLISLAVLLPCCCCAGCLPCCHAAMLPACWLACLLALLACVPCLVGF